MKLTANEIECLVFFIAERKKLWTALAIQAGVKDPERLPKELIRAHAVAMNLRKEMVTPDGV